MEGTKMICLSSGPEYYDADISAGGGQSDGQQKCSQVARGEDSAGDPASGRPADRSLVRMRGRPLSRPQV